VRILIPFENNFFGQDVGFVEKEDNLVEDLEEIHVIVAEFLDSVQQGHLGPGGLGEGRKDGDHGLDVFQRLVLEELLLLVPLDGGHDAVPDQDDGFVLGDRSLGESLLDVHQHLLGRTGTVFSDLDGFLDGAQQLVPIVDGRLILPQVDDLGQLSGHKSLGEVLIRLLSVVGGEELHQTGIEAGLFDGRYHRGAALLLLQSGQGLEEKLQSRAILDLVFVNEYGQNAGRHLTRGDPESGDLSQSGSLFGSKAFEADEDLQHLLFVHLFEVFESSGDLDEDLFPSLDFLHVCRHSENAGWRLVNLAILNDDAAGSEQSTGDDDLNEIDAVALVVEFVGGNVEKFGHGLQILTAVCQTFKDAIAKADRVVLLFFIPFPGLDARASQGWLLRLLTHTNE